jgi:tetratricopeptide (TPR) repeat protein
MEGLLIQKSTNALLIVRQTQVLISYFSGVSEFVVDSRDTLFEIVDWICLSQPSPAKECLFLVTCYRDEVVISQMSPLVIVLLAVFATGGLSAGSEATEPYAGKTSTELDKIIAQASQSIQQNPNDPKSYYQRGVAERALAALEIAAVRAEGTDHPASPAEMEIYRAYKRNMDAAIADFNKAIALDPRYGDAYLQRGLVKWDLRNIGGLPFADQARSDVHKALEINPTNVDALMVLGDLESDRSKSVEDYTRAITIQPNNSEAYAGRARFEEYLWHTDKALSDLARAIQLSPTEKKYYLQRIAIEVMQATDGSTTWDVPMPDLNKEIALDPKDLGTLSYRAFGQERLGHWKEALADYDKLLQLQPLEAVAQCRRGFVKQNLGDADGALNDFNQAVKTEPGFFPSLYCRAAVEQSRGDLTSALADMRRGLGEEPEDAEYPNIHIWIIQSLQGNRAVADQELAAYLAGKPLMYLNDWIPQIANFFLGKISEEEFLKAAKVPDPKDPGKEWEGWYYAGCKRLITGDRTTADEYFRRCAALKKMDVKLLLVSAQMENLGKSTGGL